MSLIELKPNETCLKRCKQITITLKVDLEKNGFEVSQNRILYKFCYKMCKRLELRRYEVPKSPLWIK